MHNPDNMDALNNKGNSLSKLGMFDAIYCYNKVLEINPKHIQAMYNKAYALAHVDNHTELFFSMTKCLKVTPRIQKPCIIKDIHYQHLVNMRMLLTAITRSWRSIRVTLMHGIIWLTL